MKISRALRSGSPGIPASGKSSITRELVRQLRGDGGCRLSCLNRIEMRTILTPEPTYSEEERDRFYRQLVLLGGNDQPAAA